MERLDWNCADLCTKTTLFPPTETIALEGVEGLFARSTVVSIQSDPQHGESSWTLLIRFQVSHDLRRSLNFRPLNIMPFIPSRYFRYGKKRQLNHFGILLHWCWRMFGIFCRSKLSQSHSPCGHLYCMAFNIFTGCICSVVLQSIFLEFCTMFPLDILDFIFLFILLKDSHRFITLSDQHHFHKSIELSVCSISACRKI